MRIAAETLLTLVQAVCKDQINSLNKDGHLNWCPYDIEKWTAIVNDLELIKKELKNEKDT